ncbi:MAG: hypothetical protein ACLPN5_07075 [Roseiarcus sp.]
MAAFARIAATVGPKVQQSKTELCDGVRSISSMTSNTQFSSHLRRALADSVATRAARFRMGARRAEQFTVLS